MGTGSLTLAVLLMATGAPPTDVVPMNARNFKIPIQIPDGQRDKIKELLLYASTDQGITWNMVSQVTPDQDAFKFYAPADGLYWFNICLVDANNNRQPADIYKSVPRQKVLVDTVKPIVHMTADRQGDEIIVKWDIQEEHPDPSTLKLEYRTPGAPEWMWYSTPVKAEMSGQTTFRFVNSGPVSLRMQMMDVAGNVGMDQKELPATVVAASPPAVAPAPGMMQSNGTAGAPVQPSPDMNAMSPPVPQAPAFGGQQAATQPAPTLQPVNQAPAPTPTRNLAGSNFERMPPVQQGSYAQPDRTWGPQGSSANPQTTGSGMDSESRYGANAVNQGGVAPAAFRPASPRWPGGPVTPLHITNNPQVSLDYQISKVGPSGVGRVALFLTKDDGDTWEFYGEDPDLKPPMTANLPGEGIYGLRLVVTSRAGLGGKPPKPGEKPQMRLEVDTTPPAVKLFYPQLDPTRRDRLVLTWTASDRNLAANPITLQWAERPDSDWRPIAVDLTNSGRYQWQLPPNMPYKVYLRVLARDNAGNVGVDESPEAVLIDLHEPEGELVGISGASRRP